MKAKCYLSVLAGVIVFSGAVWSPAQSCEPFAAIMAPPPIVVSVPQPVIRQVPTRIYSKVYSSGRPVPAQTTPAKSTQSTTKSSAVDYAPFMNTLQNKLKAVWSPPRPATFKPTMVNFKVLRNGEIREAKITKSSGNKDADAAAMAAIFEASPVSQLVKGAPSYVNVQFVFESSSGSSCCCGGSHCKCTHAGLCPK